MIDQSYALINLGPATSNAHDTNSANGFLWSHPLPLGNPGGYYQVDVAPLSSLEEGRLAVLLAGGVCTQKNFCTPGSLTPAVVMDAGTGLSAAAAVAGLRAVAAAVLCLRIWRVPSSGSARFPLFQPRF